VQHHSFASLASRKVPEIRRECLSSPTLRRVVLKEAREFIVNGRARNSRIRVAAVKVLVANIGSEWPRLQGWLMKFDSSSDYELHFTLFCWLDRADLPRDARLRSRVLKAVHKYLLAVPSERAQAAWMAGDLLGDHWRTRAAFRVLVDALEKAKCVAGRKGALHGLSEMASNGNPKLSSASKRLIESALEDRSKAVREYARLALRT
jgi:hypothetical protein